MKWQDALKVLGPAILAVVPGAQPFIPLLLAGMEIAENSQKPGAEKRQIARESVELGARAANTIAKREVVSEAEAVAVFDQSVDTVVNVVNLVQQISKPAQLEAPK